VGASSLVSFVVSIRLINKFADGLLLLQWFAFFRFCVLNYPRTFNLSPCTLSQLSLRLPLDFTKSDELVFFLSPIVCVRFYELTFAPLSLRLRCAHLNEFEV
jgi:hypothetical protein